MVEDRCFDASSDRHYANQRLMIGSFVRYDMITSNRFELMGNRVKAGARWWQHRRILRFCFVDVDTVGCCCHS
jgi:hypothetical protein